MRAMGMGTHHWVRDGEREEGNLSETLQRRLHCWKRKGRMGSRVEIDRVSKFGCRGGQGLPLRLIS